MFTIAAVTGGSDAVAVTGTESKCFINLVLVFRCNFSLEVHWLEVLFKTVVGVVLFRACSGSSSREIPTRSRRDRKVNEPVGKCVQYLFMFGSYSLLVGQHSRCLFTVSLTYFWAVIHLDIRCLVMIGWDFGHCRAGNDEVSVEPCCSKSRGAPDIVILSLSLGAWVSGCVVTGWSPRDGSGNGYCSVFAAMISG